MTLDEFIKPFQSVVIGSLASNGYPFSSYAPFVYSECCFYIFISALATHSKNLQSNPKASLFFIEDESSSVNIFARKRVTLQCDSQIVNKDSENFQKIIELFRQKFDASMIDMLLSLPDFSMFAFSVIAGEATLGFAKAYILLDRDKNSFIPNNQ